MKKIIKFLKKIKTYLYLKFYFWKENKIFTHLSYDEKIKLFELASKARCGIFLEIGSYLGASSCFIAAGIKRAGTNSKLYCIDTWQNDSMTEGNRDTYAEFLKNTSKYNEFIFPIRTTSVNASKTFNEKIDFLFIDGDHSYEGVKSDVDTWLPKLSDGAPVIFHDSGWAEGVKKVINEDIKPIIRNEDSLPNMWWGYLK
jgi:predicted O-methyltransferase YrrM